MHPHRPGTTINTTSLWCACKHLCNQANICADRCVCKSNCYLHTRKLWKSVHKHQKVQGAGKIAKQIFMAEYLHFVHSIAHYQQQKTSLHVKNFKAEELYHKGLLTKSVTLWHFTTQQLAVHVPPIKCIHAGNTFRVRSLPYSDMLLSLTDHTDYTDFSLRAFAPRRWRIWRILWALHAHFAISPLLADKFFTT